MPDITTAESMMPPKEAPILIDNQTFEILDRSKRDTELSRLAITHARALDLSVAYDVDVEIPGDAVDAAIVGSEKAAEQARHRGKDGRHLLVDRTGNATISRIGVEENPFETRRLLLRQQAENRMAAAKAKLAAIALV